MCFIDLEIEFDAPSASMDDQNVQFTSTANNDQQTPSNAGQPPTTTPVNAPINFPVWMQVLLLDHANVSAHRELTRLPEFAARSARFHSWHQARTRSWNPTDFAYFVRREDRDAEPMDWLQSSRNGLARRFSGGQYAGNSHLAPGTSQNPNGGQQ